MTAGAHMGVNAGGLQAGNINITGGYAAFGSKGGRVQIYGGEADPIGSEFNSWAIGGAVDIQSGRSLGVGLYGSNVNINGGYSSDNTGGTVYISGGEAGSNSSAAGSIVLSSGNQNVASADIGMGGVFISSDVRGEGLPQALVVNSKGAIGIYTIVFTRCRSYYFRRICTISKLWCGRSGVKNKCQIGTSSMGKPCI
jgi:hypothetical protein